MSFSTSRLVNIFFLGFIFICGSHTYAQDELEKINCATILSLEKCPHEILKKASQIEENFKSQSLRTAPVGESWFKFVPGQTKLLILAPHATSQIREHRVKKADTGTGSLALMLNQVADVPVLYTTFQSPVDPNYYDSSAFKIEVRDLIKKLKPDLVLDLHTSNDKRPYDVDFGTLHGKSLIHHQEYLASLKKHLENEGLDKVSDNFFAADKQETDTKWVFGLGTPCIQVEINWSWLLPAHEQKFLHLLKGLVNFSRDFKKN